MFVNFLLNRLASEAAPSFEENKCINHRQKGVICSACVDACSSGALTTCVSEVDPLTCVGCGCCVAACPTRALSPAGRIDSLFQRAQSAVPGIIGCGGSQADVAVPCLAGQPWEFYASLVVSRADHPIVLDVSSCFSCEKQKVLWILYRNLSKLRAFLGDVDYRQNVRFLYGDGDDQRPVSRREMFARFGSASRAFGLDSASVLFQPESTTHINPYRKLLWQSVNRHGNSSRWPVWSVDAACDVCGVCRAVCPNNAWEIEQKDGLAKLAFYPRRCTECSLCAANCPRTAISKAQRVEAKPKKPLVQKTKKQSVCRQCRKPYAGEALLCGPCARRDELRKELSSRIVS